MSKANEFSKERRDQLIDILSSRLIKCSACKRSSTLWVEYKDMEQGSSTFLCPTCKNALLVEEVFPKKEQGTPEQTVSEPKISVSIKPEVKSLRKAIGEKHDQNKPLAGILSDFAYALQAVTEVATHGAKKYKRGSWQDVPNGEQRYQDAKIRHWLKSRHQEYDPEFGLLHEVHELWCALAVLELKLRRLGPEKMYNPGGKA